ncbi:MAG: DUF4906 domain-containing protein [Alistipes sp.]|uniref:DUF4906 domain-containing protein n=1 Tax=Alistipes sp. TaxID=1872444 RepID=UPI0025C611E0|nr:DUF4906 domain-containing protein [Alistipes sp.]MCD8276141.1 DUF4906 domain-containing protein [Alistipes sp.]
MENDIRDLNIWLYTQAGQLAAHAYATAATTTLDCPPGTYRLVAVANAFADLGVLSLSKVSEYRISKSSVQDECLFMTARQDVTITTETRQLDIEVTRFAAKIRYSIHIDDNTSGIELVSVQPRSLPTSGMPFADTSAEEYADSEVEEIPASSSQAYAGTFYMFPNPQGTVTEITSQTDKGPQKAPKNASYLLIRARKGTEELIYTVYLGENNTDNFDVRANTSHTLDIVIRRNGMTDTRVFNYIVTITEQVLEPGTMLRGFHLEPSLMLTEVAVEGSDDLEITTTLRITEGDLSLLSVSNTPGQSEYPPIAIRPGQIRPFRFQYDITKYTPENATLSYELIFRDKYGEGPRFAFTHRYANYIQVYTHWYGGGKGYGKIISPDARAVILQETLSALIYHVFCYDSGCTMTAKPATEGSVFLAWQSEHNDMRFWWEPTYTYIPEQRKQTLYVWFD